MNRLAYPATPTVDQVDDFHGTLVADPFRWLEDPDAPATRTWIDAQNRLTFGFLADIPARPAIRARMAALWDYPKAWAPVRRGRRYFQLRNSGVQDQNVLVVLDRPDGEPRLLLDPNTLSPDGTVALAAWSVSADGRWLAYATSESGSDWLTWRIREVETGTDLPDRLAWSKFSGAAWLPDGSGFFYARYAAPAPASSLTAVNQNQQLYLHRLGRDQAADELVYARPDHPEWGFNPHVTDDGRYLLVHVWQGTDTRNRLFFRDLVAGGPMVELIPELEAAYDFVGNDGPTFYLRTDLAAPRGRLVAVDTTAFLDRARWRTILPEAEDVLESAVLAGDQLLAVYLHDAHHRIGRYDRDGRYLGELTLPGLSALVSLADEPPITARRQDVEVFYACHSFTLPPTVYRYHLRRDESTVLHAPPLDFDATPYVTRQTWATSRDGTPVPMFLVHRRDLALDGTHPTLLTGYGGFRIPMLPGFTVSRLVWLELGGVLAVTNLRGGGEYGRTWHAAGTRGNKQNVFDDFAACAEHLIEARITTPARLAIQGASNGGLLVGACLAQRPDLFGAALPAVGVMDMLRFHRFTIGWAWVSDYGCADEPAEFATLYAYSPLHNLRPGASYPATLITTADHDDRVVPGHSFKFAAALQAAQGGAAPVLIRIQTKAGHGAGKPTSIQIEEAADQWAFLIRALGMSVPPPVAPD